ncbi:prefoldin subunit alpha [Candidatus Woesearchaeota archaeon]|nr:prefoldin subunit alpha [Candidatus Woesearchaeota archaeon]
MGSVQEKYQRFQMLQQQIEQLGGHLEILNEQMQELEISKNAVTELEKTPKKNEILAPIANGIFLKAELLENKRLIVNVGSNVTVERTIPEVVQLLGQQETQVQEQIIEANAVLEQLSTQAMKIYQEVEHDVRETQREA